jgi:acetolactate synthase-1/2/3 large subunit
LAVLPMRYTNSPETSVVAPVRGICHARPTSLPEAADDKWGEFLSMAKMTGAECLAEMLQGYGVTHVFTVAAVPAFAEIERRTGLKRIHAHGETSAAYMADGYARAGGRPGVCMAPAAGALHLAAGLRDAHLAHSPVIALTGGRDPQTEIRAASPDIDDLPAFAPVTKLNATVDAVEHIPDRLRQAFRVAVSGAPGPVHLQLRGQDGQLDRDEVELDPWVEPSFASVPPVRPEPDVQSVQAALALLQAAERPVIVAGGGVRLSGAGPELVALAEALQIPVVTSLNGKDTIPGVHPLSVGVVGSYSRDSANRVVGEADLVCFVGSGTGGMTTHGWTVPQIGVAAIQIDIEAEALGRNYPLRAAVLGDAKRTLAVMLDHADRDTARLRQPWIDRMRAICRDWNDRYMPLLEAGMMPIRPERLCRELTRHVPDDAIIVADAGHAGLWIGGMFNTRSAHQSYIRSAGHLGWAFPAALGAKCACPERPVVAFTGDAGFWCHIGEVETAVRWNIRTVTVVHNNAGGSHGQRDSDRAPGAQSEQARELWTFTKVDFARVAEHMGARGIRVEHPSEIPAALKTALASDRPVVIDVVTDMAALAPLPVPPR